MRAIIDRKVYDTETALLIADDYWWDGRNHTRHGRNTFLYRTKKGAYFFHHESAWQGEGDYLEPVGIAAAIEFYERVMVRDRAQVDFAEAFPGVKLEDA